MKHFDCSSGLGAGHVGMSGLSLLPGWEATSSDVSRLSLLQPCWFSFTALPVFCREGGQKRKSNSLLLIGRNLWVGWKGTANRLHPPLSSLLSSQSFINRVLLPRWAQRASQVGRPLGDTPSPVSTRTKVLLLAFSHTRILGKISLGRKKIPLLKEKRKKTV